MSYVKTKLENIKVGNFVNLATDSSNGHDFSFEDVQVTQVVKSRDLFDSACVDLVFGKRRERFLATCPYMFDVKVPNEL